jgi:hypothetical protein
MEMKMGESHHLYEEVRSPKRPEAERVDLYLQLKGLWDKLPVRPSYNILASTCPSLPCASEVRHAHPLLLAWVLIAPALVCLQVPDGVESLGLSCRFLYREMEALLAAR